MRLSALIRRDLDPDPEITGVTADSRRVKPGYLFAALPGATTDGRRFIADALKAGAVAVIAGEPIPGFGAPVVRACDPRRAYALAAAAFWGAQPETCVAVTGTNGKTSVVTFCRQIFVACGRKGASMGTLGVQAGTEQLTPPALTSPDAGDVARLLAELAGLGVTHLALEASSHGIDQRRLDGVRLKAAGFTNLSQDHLDYHGDMASYRAAKLRLFEALLPQGATAVLNADSAEYPAFAAAASGAGLTIASVGENGEALRLVARDAVPNGQRLTVEAAGSRFDIDLPLAGAFQASNALVAAGLCIAVGEDPARVLAALEHLQGARGRMQRVGTGPKGGEAFVDYAHTPDGLKAALEALRPHARGRLIVVFGAGGDRDRAKRPLMGAIAANIADIVIVTDDNPRTEDPSAIRRAILAAAPGALEAGGRREAIRMAVGMLSDGDLLVVAGKGHEQGQTFGDRVLPFDDATEVAAALGVEAAHG
ncbi:MAG TPA: UDP-N-acetylmuramoyl-L-alanyl-D-glutamate--2,6-diaminopimelate ligase [Caulobacteraceae bacterium]|nr:UDP-N-acetylmuramoyl-L-alanyl-D-glutamate--2,6-diaminopimelate ligase [Caulobacteraceae bacterium]